MSKFLYDDKNKDDDNYDTKAIAIPKVFPKNSQAKNVHSNMNFGTRNQRTDKLTHA